MTDRRQHVHDTFTIAVKRGTQKRLRRASELLGSAPRGSAQSPTVGPVLHFEAGGGRSGTGKKVSGRGKMSGLAPSVFSSWVRCRKVVRKPRARVQRESPLVPRAREPRERWQLHLVP